MSPIPRIQGLFLACGVAVLVASCGQPEPLTPASAETTSATLPAPIELERQKLTIGRLERERDEARQVLADERFRSEEQAKAFAIRTELQRERFDLAELVSATVDVAAAELEALETKAARSPAKTRRQLERAVADLKERIAVVESEARKIGIDHGAGWPTFKSEVEAAVSDLRRAVQAATAPR
jgi:hypothetical protein